MRASRHPSILACGLLAALTVQAQEFPSGPVKIILPAPMSSDDYRVATVVAQGLSRELGKNVVVDAQGASGVSTFAASVRDGHTLLLARDSVLTLNPHLNREPALRQADAALLAIVAEEVLVLACHGASGIRSAADWRARVKQGKVTLGVLADSRQHQHQTGLLTRGAPATLPMAGYRDPEALRQAVLGASADCALFPLRSVAAKIRQGELAAVAVSAAVTSQWPGVVTFDAGLGAGVKGDAYVLAQPLGLPKAVHDALADAAARTLAKADLHRALEKEGTVAKAMAADEGRAYVRQRASYWGEQLKAGR